ncbi:MAG: type II secretion system protein GspG [Fimbriiglobus sp.]|jgi:hypothetical protein|nr:type II secretion system protein GspG [Fimbriiglobus sp.]
MTTPAPGSGLARRLLAVVVVGVVVAGVSYLTAFYFLRGSFVYMSGRWMTHTNLQLLARSVVEERELTGRYPTALTDIDGIKGAFKHDDAGQPIDYWKNPIQYAATADGFTLFSFGADGQPGGEGDNEDVFHDHPLTLPSLYRFTFELPTLPLRWVSLLTGLGAAVIVFRTQTGGRALIFQAVVTTLGALFIAFMLSVVHIPSGH